MHKLYYSFQTKENWSPMQVKNINSCY